MYTLYYSPGACSLSVHIVLEWVAADYQAIKVNPADPDYLKVNPAGAVPALGLGTSSVLTQCSAILKYLALKYPVAQLDQHDSLERDADLARWAAFLTGDLHPAFFPIFKPERYTIDSSDDALAKVKAAGIALVAKKLAVIDQHLQGRDYFTGAERSYVDAYAVPMVRWAKNVLPGGLSAFPNVARHHEELLRDPGVIKAMTSEGIQGR
ncbi:glutathione S-transferase family protein [Paucibacter sp. M5-1]|uniref:glutathione S-transferase family protein n=1 Tax=Paucibacter sp. M5-1 TaxID=3015998 RepID=UPI0022B85AB6|nr:glutathione S-transferase family protein [Paucibacter sp. M5-1]MCZ7880413.1 glutathione S-transferase family protein [Paucibacter sp. M5-1]